MLVRTYLAAAAADRFQPMELLVKVTNPFRTVWAEAECLSDQSLEPRQPAADEVVARGPTDCPLVQSV